MAKKAKKDVVTLESLKHDVDQALEKYNKVRDSKHTEEDLTKAKKVCDESIKVYNAALRHEEFDKWLKTDDPILAALTQRDVTQIATKKVTDRNTKKSTIALKNKDVMVSLPEFDSYSVVTTGKHQFVADAKGDSMTASNFVESAAEMFYGFMFDRLHVANALPDELAAKLKDADFTDVQYLTVVLNNCMNAIHDGFEAEPADYEFARSVITRKKSGYTGKGKGRKKGCVMMEITPDTIWSILTDIMAKAVNGYGYDIAVADEKEEEEAK